VENIRNSFLNFVQKTENSVSHRRYWFGEGLSINIGGIGYMDIRQTQHSVSIYSFNKMSRAKCFDPLKGSLSGHIISVYKYIKCTLTKWDAIR
jgi:hypothetical protein